MDKYEFNIKAEQMRKMVDKGDYKTAMQIADTIDWRRVRNANLLASVADIYEINAEYEEAKDILLLAFERAPIGKRFLFKLAEISVKAGDLQDAQEFYNEFSEMSPDDSRQYLLRYMILKEKGAGIEQLINPLEEYVSSEMDEEWMYELAELYARSGREDECIRLCDKITLMFALGKYVDKALELKLHFTSLNQEQMDLVNHRDKYEEKLRRVSAAYGNVETDIIEKQDPALKAQVQEEQFAQNENYFEVQDEAEKDRTIYRYSNRDSISSDNRDGISDGRMPEEHWNTTDEENYPDADLGDSYRTFSESANGSLPQETQSNDGRNPAEIDVEELMDDSEEENTSNLHNYHMIIEAKTAEEGFQIAVDEIKYFHEKYGYTFKVAKTNSRKLNDRGFEAFREKIEGKDLIIEEAGALQYDVLDEISTYIDSLEDSCSVVLVDIKDQFDQMAEDRPQFIQKFDLVSNVEEEVEDVKLEGFHSETKGEDEKIEPEESFDKERKSSSIEPRESFADESKEDPTEEYQKTYEEYEPDDHIKAREAYERDDSVYDEYPEDYYKQMSIDDFASYAQDYAKQIDCVLSGKTVLALYERIEMMQEEGIALTKAAAEDLIETAADHAEKPSFGKKLTSMFHPKYDKDDKLILREENFINE